mmetsp:Transcript_54370/g.132875  ORF Transcript_54370/g.132875 Transcript_54370/m.132875 type:complete len:293 (+) Transcript_54370:36-914(+)
MRVRPWRASLLIAATLVASAGGKAQKSSYRVPAIEALAECERRLMLAHATTDAVHAEFAERFALQSLKALGCPLSPSLPGGRRMRAKGGCASAFLCRAQSLMLMGRKRQAWDAFAGVLRSRPSDAEALASLWSMGSLAEDAGRLGLSVALFSRWAARERSARALVTLGWAQYRAGSHPDGLKTFMRALRMDPGDAQVVLALALILAPFTALLSALLAGAAEPCVLLAPCVRGPPFVHRPSTPWPEQRSCSAGPRRRSSSALCTQTSPTPCGWQSLGGGHGSAQRRALAGTLK